MSIPIAAWTMQHGKIADAFNEARGIVGSWLEHGLYDGHEEMAGEVVAGWAYVDLVERIATSLLRREGFDLEGLEIELDEASAIESVERDIIIAWERQGPTLPLNERGVS